MMDLQQVLSLVIVAAAAVFVVARTIRRRKTGKFRECADCIGQRAHQGPDPAGKG